MGARGSLTALVLLRYTLIIATGYLILVESHFRVPSTEVVVGIAVALISNVLIGRLPPQRMASFAFGLLLVLGDTIWITAVLLRSGRFEPEFFYLYFFVLLLSAIGESLQLIVVGVIAVCAAYVYVLAAQGGNWSLWDSPSLIRIPFLFTAAAFYGYMVDRTRQERGRAELEQAGRHRVQAALDITTIQLREQATVATALARVGRELISLLDTPLVVDRLCQLSCEELTAETGCTLLRQDQGETYTCVAVYGISPEDRDLARVIRISTGDLKPLLDALPDSDVLCIDTPDSMPLPIRPFAEAGRVVLIFLRSGGRLCGVQVAAWRQPQPSPFSTQQQRVAAGIAQLASMALANARLVEKLEQTDHIRSDFVASMSHELRTPLNLIIGYGDLLLDGAFGPLNPEQTENLRRLSKSSRELHELILTTLDFSRLERRPVAVDVQAVDLTTVLKELEVESRPATLNPAVSFTCRVEPSKALVHTDPLKLKIVLRNLIGNALKFTDQGAVAVNVTRREQGYEIAVSDTGIGIPQELHRRIFEPFHHYDQPGGRSYPGIGLGLYIAQRLSEVIEAHMSLESAPARGSTFRVWVPERIQNDFRRP